MFYAVEGVDGVGKTTLLENIKPIFEELGMKYWITKEPYKINYHEQEYNYHMIKVADILKDRAMHVYDIKEKLKEDEHTVVITDRYTMSSEIYQRYIDGFIPQYVHILKSDFERVLYPFRWFVLVLSPSGIVDRASKGLFDIDQQDATLINRWYIKTSKGIRRADMLINDNELHMKFNILRMVDVIYNIETNRKSVAEIARRYTVNRFIEVLGKQKPAYIDQSPTLSQYYDEVLPHLADIRKERDALLMA